MTTQKIIDTQLIRVNPDNTGLLSKVDDPDKNNKYGLNPLFTILNKDFSPDFKEDYEKQRPRTDKKGNTYSKNGWTHIINRNYIETKQKDIIRLFRETYPEKYEEELTYCLVKEDNKPKYATFQNGLNTLTRSMAISIADLEAYSERGGYESYVFSHEARPEILVFDFDFFVTAEDVEIIRETFKEHLYLMEYKEHNGHLHIYILSTPEDKITYSNQTKETLFIDEENKRVNIDVFKASERVTACTNPYNDYTIIYDEKPNKPIESDKAIFILADCLGYSVNIEFLETLLNPELAEVPTAPVTDTDTHTTYSNFYQYDDTITPPKETPQENKETIIQEATPIFIALNNSHQRETLYRSLTGSLIKHGYKSETIIELVKKIQRGTPDRENRIPSVRSCFRGQSKKVPDHLYRWLNFERIVSAYTEDPEILEHLQKLEGTIKEHDKEERAENRYYRKNNFNPTEADMMKEYIQNIENTLTLLQDLHPHFTDYLTSEVTHILRHSHLNTETINKILDPEKYSYNPYEKLSTDVNEKTQIKSLVGRYKQKLSIDISKIGENKKKQEHKQELETDLNNLEDNKKDIYNIINYNTDDIEEIRTLQYEGDIENIQSSLNKLLRLRGVIDIRLKNVLRTKCTNKIQADTLVTLSKLVNMKYNLFIVDTPQPNGKYQTNYYLTPVVYVEGTPQEMPYITVNRTWLLNEFQELVKYIPNYTPEDITLNLSMCGTILNNINNARTFNNNTVELDNIYIQRDTMKIIFKDETRETILTDDRLGLTDTTGTTEKIQLFTYDPSITVETLTPENTTDTVRIVKEILIPRQEPQRKEKFLYFIQLLGLMVHGNNDIKILPVFYRKGNNGKGVLSKIIKNIFGSGATDIKASRMSDDFLNEVIKRSKHALINDELKKNSIKDHEDIYKQVTGASGYGGRGIQSAEVDRLRELPPMFLASNYIPNIPVNEDYKAIIQRLNIIRMPNVFKNKEEVNPNLNEYEEVSGIDVIINNDYEGLSQLLSLAINEFRKLDYTGNVRNQLALTPTINDTMKFISSSNPLINFISLYTKPMDLNTPITEWITTKDIRNSFTEWYKTNNKGIEPPETLFGRNNVNIGYALQDVYTSDEVNKRKQKPSNSSNMYCFKLLTDEDKETQKKQLIEIHQYDPNNKQQKNINGATLNVYYNIKDSGLNNEKEITKKLVSEGHSAEDVVNYLKVLDQVDLIEYKEQTTL